MFLHPPQWLCVSINEVKSGIFYELPPSQHTTNEQCQNRQQIKKIDIKEVSLLVFYELPPSQCTTRE